MTLFEWHKVWLSKVKFTTFCHRPRSLNRLCRLCRLKHRRLFLSITMLSSERRSFKKSVNSNLLLTQFKPSSMPEVYQLMRLNRYFTVIPPKTYFYNSGDLNIGQVWYLNGPNLFGYQMVVWKPDKICQSFGTKCAVFWMVHQIKWSDHVKTSPKNCWKFKYSDFRCSIFRWLLYWSPEIRILIEADLKLCHFQIIRAS